MTAEARSPSKVARVGLLSGPARPGRPSRLATAKTIALAVPQTLLLRADELVG